MDIQEIANAGLILGLGGIFVVGFITLIWAGVKLEFTERDKFQKIGKAKNKEREGAGKWICAPTSECFVKNGTRGGSDFVLIKTKTLIKGFTLPDNVRKIRQTIPQSRRITARQNET